MPPVRLSVLREIGRREWDPIGLADIGGDQPGDPSADEYDTYLMQAVGLLRDGAPHEAVVEYLLWVETEYIGMSPNAEAPARARATVSAIDTYLVSIPPN